MGGELTAVACVSYQSKIGVVGSPTSKADQMPRCILSTRITTVRGEFFYTEARYTWYYCASRARPHLTAIMTALTRSHKDAHASTHPRCSPHTDERCDGIVLEASRALAAFAPIRRLAPGHALLSVSSWTLRVRQEHWQLHVKTQFSVLKKVYCMSKLF